jgi:cellulose synthase/poly-beta-1,6-N-acetylglucosamine synthase-like glycosyltransferase
VKSVVAGIKPDCGQKNNNHVQGIAATDPTSSVLVMMDSDGKCDDRLVAHLVAPLADPSLGATTGFRWYQPRWGAIGDLLRTAWNAGGFAFLINPKTCFLWGGAMAVRRATFEAAQIADLWSRTLEDDMTLTMRLRERGLRLLFVPECVVISRAADTIPSVVKWTNRQTFITRFYHKPFWIVAGVFHLLGNLVGWGLLVAGLAMVLGGRTDAIAWTALAAGAFWVLHFLLFGVMLLGPLEHLLAPRGIVLGPRKWILVLMAPFASVLQGLNTFCSVLSRRVRWAGVTYHLDAPERMHVV